MSNRTIATNFELIKQRRTEMNLTQKRLGQMLDLSEAQISLIENGKNNIKPSRIIRFASVLGVAVDDLFLKAAINSN